MLDKFQFTVIVDAPLAFLKILKTIKELHIDVKYFFIREQRDQGTITLLNISTVNQLADMFTKPLTKKDFEKFRDLIGVKEIKDY